MAIRELDPFREANGSTAGVPRFGVPPRAGIRLLEATLDTGASAGLQAAQKFRFLTVTARPRSNSSSRRLSPQPSQ
jgi:hypothetical protein